MGKHVNVDTKDLKRFERDLRNFKSKAVPYASRAYVNNQAFEARKEWQDILPSKMKLRNKYTTNSIRVDKTSSLDINRQQSIVGSLAPYMDEQEDGYKEGKSGKHGVALPAAAPSKRKTRGRISKARQLGSINIMPRIRGHRSRQVAASMAMARKRGGPQYAFLQLKKGRMGIYQLDPSRKRLAVKKVWDLSKSSVTIPKNPTMEPAVQSMAKRRDALWRDALLFQLRRHRILGY